MRSADVWVHPVPPAMTGEEIPEEELMTILEAARWAYSSYNGQPWRYFSVRLP
jgi:nitroreductase